VRTLVTKMPNFVKINETSRATLAGQEVNRERAQGRVAGAHSR
jgi:hypothetical protein